MNRFPAPRCSGKSPFERKSYTAPSNQFSYFQTGQRLKSQRDYYHPPSYSHRWNSARNFDEGNFYNEHERIKPAPYRIRESWRFPVPRYSGKSPFKRKGYSVYHNSFNSMAYILPSEQHSNDLDSLATRFKRQTNLKPEKSCTKRSGQIAYAKNATRRWFMVGSTEDEQLPASVHLEPVYLELFEWRMATTPLALVNSHLMKEESNDPSGSVLRRPWASITRKVLQELISTFEIMKTEMDFHDLEVIKPVLNATFGKILFHGRPPVSLEGIKETEVAEVMSQFKRRFYVNVPASYRENIINVVTPEIGVDFKDEKNVYHVVLSDNRRPDAAVLCKCSVTNDGELELLKVKLNKIRHMVMDISCLEKNQDLRLMLYSKRIVTSLSDDEMCSIRELISSVVPDKDVMGGLRLRPGEACSGDRFSIISVCHFILKAYSTPSLRLKVRRANRFHFKTSFGEATNEVTLKLKGVVSELQEHKGQESVSVMLEDTLKWIWEHFLSIEHSPLP